MRPIWRFTLASPSFSFRKSPLMNGKFVYTLKTFTALNEMPIYIHIYKNTYIVIRLCASIKGKGQNLIEISTLDAMRNHLRYGHEHSIKVSNVIHQGRYAPKHMCGALPLLYICEHIVYIIHAHIDELCVWIIARKGL